MVIRQPLTIVDKNKMTTDRVKKPFHVTKESNKGTPNPKNRTIKKPNTILSNYDKENRMIQMSSGSLSPLSQFGVRDLSPKNDPITSKEHQRKKEVNEEIEEEEMRFESSSSDEFIKRMPLTKSFYDETCLSEDFCSARETSPEKSGPDASVKEPQLEVTVVKSTMFSNAWETSQKKDIMTYFTEQNITHLLKQRDLLWQQLSEIRRREEQLYSELKQVENKIGDAMTIQMGTRMKI